jgi:hypothetical protein
VCDPVWFCRALQAPEAGADLKKIEGILDGNAPATEKKVRAERPCCAKGRAPHQMSQTAKRALPGSVGAELCFDV